MSCTADLTRIFHTRAWRFTPPRRFAPPLSGEGTRSAAGEIPLERGARQGGVFGRIWKCERPGLTPKSNWRSQQRQSYQELRHQFPY